MSDERVYFSEASRERRASDPFRRAAGWVGMAWLLGGLVVCLICLVVSTLTATERAAMIVVSFGSGLIGIAAMGVGTLVDRSRQSSERGSGKVESADSSSLVSAALAGMLLRLVGTVALFLTCRYHMAAAADVIVILTLGWYLYLTSVELFVLVRELKRIDRGGTFERGSIPDLGS